MIFYAIFLLFKLIYPLPTIHKFIKDIELCVAEFFVFKPYFHNDRAIYFIRRTSARMTHTAVFALLPVLDLAEKIMFMLKNGAGYSQYLSTNNYGNADEIEGYYEIFG